MTDKDIILRPFTASDLKRVDPNNSFVGREGVLASYNSLFTFEYDGEPIMCAGLVKLWDGVAEAWTVLSDFAKDHPRWVVKRLRAELRNQIAAMNLRRVQMHVEDSHALLKWGHVLGFHCEGTMKHYTKEGKTLHILALFPK